MTYILITRGNLTRIDATMWERVKGYFKYSLGQSDTKTQDVHIYGFTKRT